MGVFNIFKKKSDIEKQMQYAKTNSIGEPLDKLTPDGELPFGWVTYNKEFIDKHEALIDNQWKKVYSPSSTEEKLKEYRTYFDVVNSVGESCKAAGECHYKWFEYHIITSEWYNQQVNAYKELKQKAPKLIKQEHLLKTLENDVIDKLRKNEGIFQSDFVKLFDPIIKNDVTDLLYNMDKSGLIERIKSGRSYILKLKR